MTSIRTVILWGAAALFLNSTIGGFVNGYEDLFIAIAFSINALSGFYTYRLSSKIKIATGVGALLGLFESTAGWWISNLIDPHLEDATAIEIAFVIVFVMATGAAFGLLGGFLAKLVKKN